MNLHILDKEVQEYISEHLDTDVLSLLFKKTPFPNVSFKELVEQIESKSKSKKKLPSWFSASNIYYPNKLNISQTSSETTADYKAGITYGKTLLDVTGGFGVDSYAFSKKIDRVYHLEENEELSQIASHNFKALKADAITVVSGDGLKFLSTSKIDFDWIFIDPSRRTKNKEKVFFLSDCQPDVTQHLDVLFSKSNNILIKAGPLLDLDAGTKELKYTKEIHIVAVNNEVKELLWVLKKGYDDSILVKTINLHKNDKQVFSFNLEEEKEATSTYSEPQTYLYEPNTATLKSGAYKLAGERHGLKKLNQHSHLYTSTQLSKFPGRIFKIQQVVPYNNKYFKSLGIKKANVTVRNFPISVASIRKKLKLKDGGENYLFFTKNMLDELIVISCKKT